MAKDDEFDRRLLLIIGILAIPPILIMVFAWPMMGTWVGGHMWSGGMWNRLGLPEIWLVMWLVLLLILLSGAYLLYQLLIRPDGDTPDAALEELRIAYAQGELSDEQFEKRRDRLQRYGNS
jgi:putative membrane protein